MTLETTPWSIQDALKTPEERAAFIAAALEEAGDDPAFIALVLDEVACARGARQIPPIT